MLIMVGSIARAPVDVVLSGRCDAPQWRTGVRAAACLAGEAFGCLGMEAYRFDVSQGGVPAFAFDDAPGALGDLEGVDGMSGTRTAGLQRHSPGLGVTRSG